MTRIPISAIFIAALLAIFSAKAAHAQDDRKLNIMVIGAHPDDAELGAGGVAAKWAEQGHRVKMVSVTNGDIGHWEMAGGPLAQRRIGEVGKAAEILGVESEVLDNHDGELMPTLENRKKITRLIREWNADLVITHRPNDYHPDHRYTAILVQDAAFMVTVPFFCPDTPHLEKNPVFMYAPDRFEKPNPFEADIAVSIDDTIDELLAALGVMESQFYEGGVSGHPDLVPDDAAGQEARREEVRERFKARYAGWADRFRETLAEYYGEDAAEDIEYAQAYEICEYGHQPSREELLALFPFVPKTK